MSADWIHKDLWGRRGTNFLVQISRHEEPLPDTYQEGWDEGPHRWCVYAFIYPEHPSYANFSGDKMWQDAALALPLHHGPSLLRWHRGEDGKPSSVQIGADYHHLGDERYTHAATLDRAYTVMHDAEELFKHLENRATTKTEGGAA